MVDINSWSNEQPIVLVPENHAKKGGLGAIGRCANDLANQFWSKVISYFWTQPYSGVPL